LIIGVNVHAYYQKKQRMIKGTSIHWKSFCAKSTTKLCWTL